MLRIKVSIGDSFKGWFRRVDIIGGNFAFNALEKLKLRYFGRFARLDSCDTVGGLNGSKSNTLV